MTKLAALYLRQSLAKEGDELGVNRQEAECRRVCVQRDYQVVRVLTDNNVSASIGKRPAYQELLKLIESGEVEVVVVLRLDRLLRKVTELETLIELSERTGVQIVTVQGDLDISNAQGRLIGRVLASVARGEVEVKSERHKLANRQKAALGKPHGSRRAFGYEDDLLTIREDEAALFREMARKVMAGEGYREVAYWMNRQGHLTTTGKLWYPITIRNMLSKKRYAGIRTYLGEEFPGAWPAILEPEEFERLQLVMRSRKMKYGGMGALAARKYLLTGMAVCGKCGLGLTGCAMTDRPGAPKRRVYSCRGNRDTGLVRGCGGVRRNADALDDFVFRTVLHRLDSPDMAALLSKGGNSGELEVLLANRQAQQDRLDGFVDDYATGLLERPEFERAKATAKTELDRLDALIEKAKQELQGINLKPGETIQQAWDDHGNDWRRAFLGLFIKQVVVNPGLSKPYYWLADGTRARFDPNLIHIDWIA